MSYESDDQGQFKESTVFLHPLTKFNTPAVHALNKYSNPESTNLGIYDGIKLSPLLTNKSGQVIQFITLDQRSHNTFVTAQALTLLQRYSTDDLAFVMVVGNRGAGKSFFCDKILNLSETRGNHFCRKSGKGIHLWTTPFQKDDLKVFLLEISNCDIDSEEFRLLSTYALLISSAFIVVQPHKNSRNSSIQQLDEVICGVAERITPSMLKKSGVQQHQNNNSFIPRLFYSLSRNQDKKVNQDLKVIKFYALEYLPNALAKGYPGNSQDLVHVPFLDTKCVSEQYVRRVAAIFRDVFSKIEEKRYNQLVLNGNIISKIIKYVENYINKKHDINIESVYEQIIDDLYLSAYNYCILTYHDQMQRQFDDEQPKSYDDLLRIFEVISDSVLKKFEEFNLDKKMHALYEQKLEKHILEKEKMLLEINAKKTEAFILDAYNDKEIANVQYYRAFLAKVNRDYAHLNHSRAEIIGKINTDFYTRTKGSNNIEYKIMKEVQNLKATISQHKQILKQVTAQNFQMNKKKSNLHQSQQQFVNKDQALQGAIRQLKNQIAQVKNTANFDQPKLIEDEKHLNATIAANQKTIEDLKTNKGKDAKVTSFQNKLEDLKRKIVMQQTLLRELNQSGPTETEKKGNQGEPKQSEAPKPKPNKK